MRASQLELLDHVRDPAFAEAFPGEHLDRAGSQHRPQRHLDRAGIGGGHDPDAIIGRNLEDLAGQIDGAFQARLAELRPVGAAQRVGFEIFEDHPGRLAQGPEEKKGERGRAAGRSVMAIHPSRWLPLGGGGVSRRRICRIQATASSTVARKFLGAYYEIVIQNVVFAAVWSLLAGTTCATSMAT